MDLSVARLAIGFINVFQAASLMVLSLVAPDVVKLRWWEYILMFPFVVVSAVYWAVPSTMTWSEPLLAVSIVVSFTAYCFAVTRLFRQAQSAVAFRAAATAAADFEDSIRPILTEALKPLSEAVEAMRDLSSSEEFAKALAARRLLREQDSHVDAMPAILWFAQPDGRITYSKGKALEDFNLKPDEAVDSNVQDWGQWGGFRKVLQNFQEGITETVTVRLGPPFDSVIAYSPRVVNGRLSGVIGVTLQMSSALTEEESEQ